MDSPLHKRGPHRQNGRFYNHLDERRPHLFVPSLSMLIECYWNTRKKHTIDKDYWFAPSERTISSSEACAVTWIGHSTFLIESHDISILTDPIFGDLPLFRRQLPPGIALSEMPAVDYILISHNHRDHMDAFSLKFFKRYEHTHFLVPQGDKAWFTRRGFKNVSEYSWWGQKIVTHHEIPLTLTFLPALHWSQRGIFDFNKSLWGSWMITLGNKHIYFAGDTAYSPHFGHIAQEFTDISLALMPIGPCEPRQWMSYAHVSAEEAGQAFLDLNAHHFIPMHWGTFSFGTDPHASPVERITQWWRKQDLPTKQLTVLKFGQRVHPDFDDQAMLTPPTQIITELGS